MNKICPKYKAALIQALASNVNIYDIACVMEIVAKDCTLPLIQCDRENCQNWETLRGYLDNSSYLELDVNGELHGRCGFGGDWEKVE